MKFAVGDLLLGAVVNQQLGTVAILLREKSDALIRQIVIEIFNADVFLLKHHMEQIQL